MLLPALMLWLASATLNKALTPLELLFKVALANKVMPVNVENRLTGPNRYYILFAGNAQ